MKKLAVTKANQIRRKPIKSFGEVLFLNLYNEYVICKNKDVAIKNAVTRSGLEDPFIEEYITSLFDECIW